MVKQNSRKQEASQMRIESFFDSNADLKSKDVEKKKKEGRLEYVARMIKTHMIDQGMPLYSFPDWIRGYLKDVDINIVWYNGEKRVLRTMNRNELQEYAYDVVKRFYKSS